MSMTRQSRRQAMLSICMGICAIWFGASSHAQTAAPRPVVYVQDFELDAADVKPDDSRVERIRRLGQGIIPRPMGPSSDPQTHAKQIVTEMSTSLSEDLQKAGFDVRRLPLDQPLPTNGWLVRGVFLSVDEGNRVKRAVVGFGAGQGTIEVAVAIDNVAAQSPSPLYQTVEEQGSGHKPGAAVTLNPYVAAAKFVMSRGDEKKMIDQTAKQISGEVVKKVGVAN